jgi:hypothetical protein
MTPPIDLTLGEALRAALLAEYRRPGRPAAQPRAPGGRKDVWEDWPQV